MTELQTELTTTTRRPVNLRSFTVGVAGVVFIAALTPYNDFVAGNTMLIGNYLPIGLFMFFLFFLAAINAPLRKWAPSLALSRGELAVAMGMVLVSCSIPGSGLMRYLPSQLVAVWNSAGQNPEHAKLLNEMNLPSWLFPTMHSTEATQRASEDVVKHFISRVPIQDDSFLARWNAVPWSAWITPALTWAIPVTGFLGAVLCMSVILRKQWVENERLAFPLATVYLALIDEPPPGKAFNSLIASRGFVIAFACVFLVHSLNALHIYNEKLWPEIRVHYNITKLMSEAPWSYLSTRVSTGALYFSIIGVTLFLQTKVSFSLWAFFVVMQALRVIFGPDRMEMTAAAQADQTFGMLIPFSATIFWIGRHHWWHVITRMFAPPTDEGRYIPYFFAGWGMIACILMVIVWLCFAGATFLGATFIVLTAMVIFLAIARIVAETGLPFVGINTPAYRPWFFFMQDLPSGLAFKTPLKNFFFSCLFTTIFTNPQREHLEGYGPHALRIADGAAYERNRSARGTMGFIGCLVGALVISYVVSGASTLYCEYSHYVQLSKSGWSPLNTHSVETQIKNITLGPPRNWQAGTGINEAHDRWMHLGIGAGGMTFLSVMRFKFAGWPFHPIGYMMAGTYVMDKMWLSIFAGWLSKVLIVRFGGASMMIKARPIFIGLIVGEAGAAGFWVAVSLVRIAMGLDFEEVRFLPG